MSQRPDLALATLIVKVAARCNLDCDYCYMFNQADQSWRRRPKRMTDSVFAALVQRVAEHCRLTGQPRVRLVLHGGEPCLVGAATVDRWASLARAHLGGVSRLSLSIQTNGTLIDDDWIAILKRHDFDVGVSCDGPPEIHDAHRFDHGGRGSHAHVVRGIARIRDAGIPFAILCVAEPGTDGIDVHRHLVDELGARSINYLLPDVTHVTVLDYQRRYGRTPCADHLIPVFDEWWSRDSINVEVTTFTNIARIILGGRSRSDALGNEPLGFAFVETDGDIEGLDVLRVCGEGVASTQTNVLHNPLRMLGEHSELHRQSIFTGLPRPTACFGCREEETCSGGYLPHRWHPVHGFDNPSAWCADLLALFAHVRRALDVSPKDTELRRRALQEVAADALSAPVALSPPVTVDSRK